jgi:coronin-7
MEDLYLIIGTATEDGRIRVWTIPDDGLTADVEEPTHSFSAHANRVALLVFHPFVSDVLMSVCWVVYQPAAAYWTYDFLHLGIS